MSPGRSAARTRALAIPLVLGLGLSAGCLENEGIDPPAGQLSFPVAIALSPPREGEPSEQIFVVNSNFDLRYNAGSVQAYDLACVHAAIERCRGEEECSVVEDRDRCLRDEVFIGSHAAGLAVGPRGAGIRLYIPVRSDANLTYVDVDPAGMLACGESSVCDERHRQGDESLDVRLPEEPVAVHAGALSDLGPALPGNYVLMAHRAGAVSLFVDEERGGESVPQLRATATGFPDQLVGMRFDPDTRLAWLNSAIEPRVGRAGIAIDANTDALSGTLLFNGGNLTLTGLDTGAIGRGDTRDVQFDPRDLDADPDNDVGRAYVLSRRPQSLLVADLAGGRSGQLGIVDVIEVGNGPSRLEVVQVRGRTLGLVSCFDGREIYVLDLDLRKLAGIVTGVSGPFEMQIDPVREVLYVCDFRASVIRVVELEGILDCIDGTVTGQECSPSVLGGIGEQRPIVELR